MEEQIAVKGNNKSKKSSKKNKNNKNNLEIEKNRKYWIYRGLGIGGGVLALITLFLPWYQVIGSVLLTITPIYIYYNGYYMYFWDYYVAINIDYGFLVIIIAMDICLALIILSTIYSLIKLSRAPSSMIMTTIILSFLFFSIPVAVMSILSNSFPFFGFDGVNLWGFTIGWFLLIPAMILSMFFRKLVINKKEKIQKEWKEKVKEMQD